MSEYHSFSLTEHVPSSKDKHTSKHKIANNQKNQNNRVHKFNIQTADDFSVNKNNNPVPNIDSSMNTTDQINKNNGDWTGQTNSFQDLNTILSNMADYNQKTDHGDPYNQLFEFIPFDESTTTNNIAASNSNDKNNHTNSLYHTENVTSEYQLDNGHQTYDTEDSIRHYHTDNTIHNYPTENSHNHNFHTEINNNHNHNNYFTENNHNFQTNDNYNYRTQDVSNNYDIDHNSHIDDGVSNPHLQQNPPAIFLRESTSVNSNKNMVKSSKHQNEDHGQIMSDFNDHDYDMFEFSDPNSGQRNQILPYLDSLNDHFNTGSKDNSLMYTSSLTDNQNSFSTITTTTSPSPTVATSSSSPAYQISNVPLVQPEIQTPSILEFQSSTQNHIGSTIPYITAQSECTLNKIRATIQNHLYADDPIDVGERSVIITTSKVAQKSYGTEKRFLCPPPTVTLAGSSWWTPPKNSFKKNPLKEKEDSVRAPPLLSISISGESTTHQSGRIEWYSVPGTLIGQTGSTKNQKHSEIRNHSDQSNLQSGTADDWYRNAKKETLAGGRCVLKRLYINDADEKRKKVECLIKVQLANGLALGTFSSQGIKVISKPSKKRQSVKNAELCIYHGTTVSLFNRIRSQTVSTKYLGVSSNSGDSSVFDYPGRYRKHEPNANSNADTCFVARTGSWDPFIVWIVDSATRRTNETNTSSQADEYIGCPSIVPNIPYPQPPTVALKNKTKHPLAVRYNQHIVLQCLTTGLVSPVMIIRKVEKASAVVGGAHCPDEIDQDFSGGGEFGDEVLGDPVSQLHKIAFQIVQSNAVPEPRDTNSMMPFMTPKVNYLACLNDLVGTHKTIDKRAPIKNNIDFKNNLTLAAAAAVSSVYDMNTNRKRRASMLEDHSGLMLMPDQFSLDSTRRRFSTLNDTLLEHGSHHSLAQRSHSISVPSSSPYQDRSATANRKYSLVSSSAQALAEYGAYWSENISDSAIWTIVGTECAKYTFWTPSFLDENSPEENQIIVPPNTLFPNLNHYTISNDNFNENNHNIMMTVSGENFTQDLQIWFGDIKAPYTEYRNHDMLLCKLPSREELLKSTGLNCPHDKHDLENDINRRKPKLPHNIRILLVRGDGIIYKTNRFYTFL